MKKIKTKWNLNLFYKSANDTQIKKDIEKIKKAFIFFEKKYIKKDDYLKKEDKLFQALLDYENLIKLDTDKPLLYFHYRKDLDGKDQEAEANLNKLINELTKYENKILFFLLKIGKIEKKFQKKFLSGKKLRKYNYFLEKIFEMSKYDLAEKEEKIINLKNMPSHSMWVSGVQRTLSKQNVKFRGKEISIGEAQNKVSGLNTIERRALQDKVLEKIKEISSFAESEINAIVLNKKIDDELRGFKNPYSATILGYENNEKSILDFANIVTKHFYISNRFYNLKKKILKLDYMRYADRGARIGKTTKKISFKEAYEILKSIFKSIDKEYADILDNMLKKGQIDAYPKIGKSDGAYASSSVNTPTMVLLNQTDDFKSLMTFAHEMGHAIHSELSKKNQIEIYTHYSISAAETASTFFEQAVFDAIFEKLNNKEKIVALHDKIQGDIDTIFRQIAEFNFEIELHNSIRQKGALSSEEIGSMLNKHMKMYLGPAFKLKELDGYFFIRWSHIRNFFYVYTYAYGQIISKIMYDRFKKNNNFGKQIKKFLSAGGSKSPDDIFKDIGIDTARHNFFKEGLISIEKDINKLEKVYSA
ncbi:hypothetical protein COT82_02550 [Candidatus Campbellbacteria bacterium CG10_big_fil_rev_8_21_14_0_10_35_52]|uniref:Oligoendopeptidase F n=1 Tax=Candidatus Campbellbacteria bacterium CG10_big_fil_rev_8_21_14_0_10_35_52 TaxID=1974527 RepID=A0A2M6WUV7_9BACT|nr:MAG: hypothetical protein COT82_02550 [Candidatus Campbellbacteria bacterium CG10_big_fil_rev_8_21_14_0_10_35_52]